MNKENKIPLIRFKGYTEDWEQRKLGEVAEFNPKSELPEMFEYVDLESVIGTEMISHRTETKASAPSRAQRLAKMGDVFYQTVRPYQRNNYLFDKPDNNYVFSTGYAQMRPSIDSSFLMNFIQTDGFVKIVLDNCTGTSYPAINSSDLANLVITYPVNIEEQTKIGSYFENLDHLITLHQRKCESLKKVKKSMLQKMFPKNGESVPEIRFAGFTDPWEQRKLGEMSLLITKGTTPINKSGEGTINFIKIENINADNGEIIPEMKISEDEHNGYLKRSQLQENDILFSIAGTLGRVSTVKSSILPANTNQALAIIRIKDGVLNYITTVLKGNAVTDFIKKNPTVGAQPNLSLEQVGNLEIPYPILSEQTKIGSYFQSLDNLITLHQRKVEKLKNIKKSMLQKMFV